METIKVIDLLNKIANGEEVPECIMYQGHYYYNVGNEEQAYYENTELDDNLFLYAIHNEAHLNDEVEIIEEPRNIEICGSLFTKSEYDELAKSNEDKKIEKMEFCYEVADEMQNANNERFRDFINEIIDKVNGE